LEISIDIFSFSSSGKAILGVALYAVRKLVLDMGYLIDMKEKRGGLALSLGQWWAVLVVRCLRCAPWALKARVAEIT
jgi:hypothetical protein